MMTRTEEAISVTVNGETRTLPEGSTVADLLRTMDRDPEAAQGVAVAVNETVLRRQDWGAHMLQAGDTVEVITALQGG